MVVPFLPPAGDHLWPSQSDFCSDSLLFPLTNLRVSELFHFLVHQGNSRTSFFLEPTGI